MVASFDLVGYAKNFGGSMSRAGRDTTMRTLAEKLEVEVGNRNFTSLIALVNFVWEGAGDAMLELDPVHYTMFFSFLGNAIEELPVVKRDYPVQGKMVRYAFEAVGTGIGISMAGAKATGLLKADKKLSEDELERSRKEVVGRLETMTAAPPGGDDDVNDVEPTPVITQGLLARLVAEDKDGHFAALFGAASNAIYFDQDNGRSEEDSSDGEEGSSEPDDLADTPTEEHTLLDLAVIAFRGVSDDPVKQKKDQSTWPIMNRLMGEAQSFVGWCLSMVVWVLSSPRAAWRWLMSIWDDVYGVFADFLDIFSMGGASADRFTSLDGLGNQLKEALIKMAKEDPDGLVGLLKPNVNIGAILDDPLSLETGSYKEIMILLGMNDASLAAKGLDSADLMIDWPTLKRVMADRSRIAVLIGLLGGLVYLMFTSPSTFWGFVSNVTGIVTSPGKFIGRSMIAALLIGATLVMGYYGFLNLLYGWGVIGSVSYVSLWSFLSGGGPVDAAGQVVKLSMHVWPQVVGFCLAFVSRLTVGQVDGFLPGSEESPTTDAHLARNTDGTVITTLQRAMMSDAGRESLEAEEEKNLKRRKEMFTGAKLRRTATTLMMIICILQLVASGTWILVYLEAPEVLVTGFSWGGSMIVVFTGVIVETMARFPAMFTFLEKKGMMKKGIDGLNDVLRFGGKAVVAFFVFAVLISGLNVTWIGFQNTAGGKLVVNTIDYEVKRQTERLEAKKGGLVKVTKSRKSASPSTSKKGDLPSMCKKPENVVKFRICRE